MSEMSEIPWEEVAKTQCYNDMRERIDRLRVPGGWIYVYKSFDDDQVVAVTSVFVPDPVK